MRRVNAIVRFLLTIQALTRLPSSATYEDLQYVLTQLQDDQLSRSGVRRHLALDQSAAVAYRRC
jgi:hypothetical protein